MALGGVAVVVILRILQLEPFVCSNGVLCSELKGVREEPDLERHLPRCKEPEKRYKLRFFQIIMYSNI